MTHVATYENSLAVNRGACQVYRTTGTEFPPGIPKAFPVNRKGEKPPLGIPGIGKERGKKGAQELERTAGGLAVSDEGQGAGL
ncbi:hypothetical protein ES708_22595 [subsurface metagenome]